MTMIKLTCNRCGAEASEDNWVTSGFTNTHNICERCQRKRGKPDAIDISTGNLVEIKTAPPGLEPPPIIDPYLFNRAIEDAEQQGYLTGYNYAKQLQPISYTTSLIVGFTIGFLTAFFTFYRG